MNNYDIAAGKIADDRTNVTITTYLVGGYGVIGSESADKACISQLIPERIKDQYCFRTMRRLNASHLWKVRRYG